MSAQQPTGVVVTNGNGSENDFIVLWQRFWWIVFVFGGLAFVALLMIIGLARDISRKRREAREARIRDLANGNAQFTILDDPGPEVKAVVGGWHPLSPGGGSGIAIPKLRVGDFASSVAAADAPPKPYDAHLADVLAMNARSTPNSKPNFITSVLDRLRPAPSPGRDIELPGGPINDGSTSSREESPRPTPFFGKRSSSGGSPVSSSPRKTGSPRVVTEGPPAGPPPVAYESPRAIAGPGRVIVKTMTPVPASAWSGEDPRDVAYARLLAMPPPGPSRNAIERADPDV
jgi:hypothetical protein